MGHRILKGNPLGDPHVRKLGVWLPPARGLARAGGGRADGGPAGPGVHRDARASARGGRGRAAMMLPNAAEARVPEDKIVKYLLSATHRAGKSKAAFFARFERVERLTGRI